MNRAERRRAARCEPLAFEVDVAATVEAITAGRITGDDALVAAALLLRSARVNGITFPPGTTPQELVRILRQVGGVE